MTNIQPIHEKILPEEMYKFRGLLWQPVHNISHRTGHESYDVESTPYCPKCMAKLTPKSDYDLRCELCEVGYEARPNTNHVAGLASRAYNAKLKEHWKVISLDLPPDVIKSKDENSDYWVEARIGQKNGKLMAVVYFGDKRRKEDGKKAYSQVFIDFDDEQMRFDKANKNPLEVIAKLEAEFLASVHTSTKKKRSS